MLKHILKTYNKFFRRKIKSEENQAFYKIKCMSYACSPVLFETFLIIFFVHANTLNIFSTNKRILKFTRFVRN